MTDHRPDDALNDTLAREIESALNVDPSPDFVARVRARVAAEPARDRWSVARWMPPSVAARAVGVAVLVGAVVAVMMTSTQSTSSGVGQPEVARPAASSTPTIAMALTSPVPSSARTSNAGRSNTPGSNAAPLRGASRTAARHVRMGIGRRPGVRPVGSELAGFPEVLISEEDQRSFQRLVRLAQANALPPFPALDAASLNLPVKVPAIVIPPLTIDPIPQIARIETQGDLP